MATNGTFTTQTIAEFNNVPNQKNIITVTLRPDNVIDDAGFIYISGLTGSQTPNNGQLPIDGSGSLFGGKGDWNQTDGYLKLDIADGKSIPDDEDTIIKFRLRNKLTAQLAQTVTLSGEGTNLVFANGDFTEDVLTSGGIIAQFATKEVSEGDKMQWQPNEITFKIKPQYLMRAGEKITFINIKNSLTPSNSQIPIDGSGALFGGKGEWDASLNQLVLTVAPGKTIPTDKDTFIKITLQNNGKQVVPIRPKIALNHPSVDLPAYFTNAVGVGGVDVLGANTPLQGTIINATINESTKEQGKINTIVLDFSVDVTLRNSITPNKHQIRLIMGNTVKNFGGGAPIGTIYIEGGGDGLLDARQLFGPTAQYNNDTGILNLQVKKPVKKHHNINVVFRLKNSTRPKTEINSIVLKGHSSPGTPGDGGVQLPDFNVTGGILSSTKPPVFDDGGMLVLLIVEESNRVLDENNTITVKFKPRKNIDAVGTTTIKLLNLDGTQTPDNNALPITGSGAGLFGNSGVWKKKGVLTLTTTQAIQGDEEDKSNPVEIKFTLKNNKGGDAQNFIIVDIDADTLEGQQLAQRGILGVRKVYRFPKRLKYSMSNTNFRQMLGRRKLRINDTTRNVNLTSNSRADGTGDRLLRLKARQISRDRSSA